MTERPPYRAIRGTIRERDGPAGAARGPGEGGVDVRSCNLECHGYNVSNARVARDPHGTPAAAKRSVGRPVLHGRPAYSALSYGRSGNVGFIGPGVAGRFTRSAVRLMPCGRSSLGLRKTRDLCWPALLADSCPLESTTGGRGGRAGRHHDYHSPAPNAQPLRHEGLQKKAPVRLPGRDVRILLQVADNSDQSPNQLDEAVDGHSLLQRQRRIPSTAAALRPEVLREGC